MRGRTLWLRVASVVVVLFCLALGAGCGGSGSGNAQGKGSSGGGGRLTVLAASSLTDAFKELAGRFEKQDPGTEVRTSFAASSELLAQIKQGAPADVFAPASKKNMDAAAKKDLVGKAAAFARNRPVVIVPANNPAGIKKFEDLARANAQLVLAEDGVPIADYAMQVLSKANAEYGAGFKKSVMDKVVSREANVRAAANKVALGEADGTFVYASDVTPDIRNKVRVVQIPDGVNVVATYPIATVRGSKEPKLAQAWADLVLSDEGQGVLKKHGFEPAPAS